VLGPEPFALAPLPLSERMERSAAEAVIEQLDRGGAHPGFEAN